MARMLPLTNSDRRILVDDDDYELMSKHSWHISTSGREVKGWTGAQVISAGVFLMHPPKGKIVDHINRDIYDFRRENLRIVTHSQSAMNRRGWGAVPYKGVTRFRDKFQAQIQRDHVRIYLGLFDTAEAAARVYDDVARELHGDFAVLNFDEPAYAYDD